MIRGPLYGEGYRPQLSGHETFPLRYGWLKKAFDAVDGAERPEERRAVFSTDDAIARFGVGKNMVASMRHWATAAGVIRDDRESQRTELNRISGACCSMIPASTRTWSRPPPRGLSIGNVSGRPYKTTWFWAFSHFPGARVRARHARAWRGRPGKGAVVVTVARPRSAETYRALYEHTCTKRPHHRAGYEDSLESPLAELGLIRRVGKRDGFRFVRGAKTIPRCWRVWVRRH